MKNVLNSRMILGIIALAAMGGCATTQTPSTMNNLEIKVAHLERSFNEQSQVIDSLKYQVEDLSRQLDTTDTMAARPVEEPVLPKEPSFKTSASADEEIVRVDVSASDVQKALKAAGYYEGTLDGKIGSGTKRAIKNFQKDYGLTVDGVIGKKTWSEMKVFLK